MAENVAPNASADSTRGLPYYEKLKRDLRETLKKKLVLDKSLANLEENIYRFEASYLEETGAGNIIKGFDNYIKGSSATTGTSSGTTTGGGGTSTRRKGQVMEVDRVFSRSSASFMRVGLFPHGPDHAGDTGYTIGDSPDPSSVQTTPSHAPTPTSSFQVPASARESNHPTPTSATSTKAGGGAASKKNKKGPDKEDEESEGKQPKRLKITYARGGAGGD
ncbi:Chromatin modification- protein meaf6 [Hypocenomyce scalaris]|nr:Chromatin modification- protein meaf6 [Hypocenomyce scalaris]